MKKYFAFLGVIALIFSVVLLSGCNEENKPDNNGNVNSTGFIGDWKLDDPNGDDTWTFYNGSTGKRTTIYQGQEPYTQFFIWKINNSNLCITFEENERCGTYSFTNQSKTFNWTVKRGEDTLITTFNRII